MDLISPPVQLMNEDSNSKFNIKPNLRPDKSVKESHLTVKSDNKE